MILPRLSLKSDASNDNHSILNVRCLMLAILLGCTISLDAYGEESDTLNARLSDSLLFCKVMWNTQTCDGFRYKHHHFLSDSLFGSNQYICILEIPPDSKCRLAFVTDTILNTTSSMAQRCNAKAAVNGSYFDMDEGNPICYLRIDGVELGENTPGKNDSINRKYYQYATIVLHDGHPKLIVPDSNRMWEQCLRDSNVMTAGPLLIHQGKTLSQRVDRTFVTSRHNRTALGIRQDGTVLLLTADGRFKKRADGLSLNELALLFQWLGCTEAINLDGGGSTTMYVRGVNDNGIVNYPSDNCKFTHAGERLVSNIIIVK